MANLLTTMFSRVAQRKRDFEIGLQDDLQSFVVKLAQAELHGDTAEIPEHVLDHAASVLEAANLSQADLRANVERYKQRVRQAEQAGQLEHLQSEARRLADEADEFDREETERHREALKKLADMQQSARHAAGAASRAVGALEELRAGAATTDEERELAEQLAQLRKQEQPLRDGLNHNVAVPAHLMPDAQEFPAAFVRVVESQLAALQRGRVAQPEKKRTLQERLAIGKQHVADFERRLVELQTKREQINARTKELAGEKTRPENFEITRSRQTRGEVQKRHAAAIGFAATP